MENHPLRDLEDISEISPEAFLGVLKGLGWPYDRNCDYWEIHGISV